MNTNFIVRNGHKADLRHINRLSGAIYYAMHLQLGGEHVKQNSRKKLTIGWKNKIKNRNKTGEINL